MIIIVIIIIIKEIQKMKQWNEFSRDWSSRLL